MSSPLKKRKLNHGSKTTAQPKGLEYFFSKQKENGSAVVEDQGKASAELSDDELARRIQAKWDQEVASEAQRRDTALKTKFENPEPGLSSITGFPKAETKVPPKNSEASEPAATMSSSTLSLQSTGTAEDEVNSSIPLDESPLTFDPSKYVPQLRQYWASDDGNASYSLLTRCFVLVSATTSRIKIVDTLVNCLRVLIEGDSSSLLPSVRSKSFAGRLSSFLTWAGLAGYECNIPTLHLTGAGLGRIGNIKGPEASLWPGQPRPESNL